MAKGAYLVNERRKLLVRLGEEVFSQAQKGALQMEPLEPLLHQVERLTKKIEIEDRLIRHMQKRAQGRANPDEPPHTHSSE